MRVGRPSKLKDVLIQKIPELIKLGCSDRKMAELFGVSQQTLLNWKANNSEFLVTYNLEKLKADNNVEASLYQRAIGQVVRETRTTESNRGDSTVVIERELPGDVEAQKFWLVNRRSDQWQYSQEQQQIQGNITINLSVPRPGSTDAKILDVAANAVPRPTLGK